MTLLVLLVPMELSRRSGLIAGDPPMRNLSAMVGWISLSLLILALIAAMRIPGLIAALGLHPVTRVHAVLGILAAVAALAHLLLVVVSKPSDLGLLVLTRAPPRAVAAVTSTVALVLIVWFSLRRRDVHAHYEQWRAVHGLLAVTAFIGALLHVVLLEHLIRDDSIALVTLGAGTVVAAGLIMLWVGQPMIAARRPYRLVERSVEGDLVRLTFAPAAGRAVPRYQAGQFIRVQAVDGPPEFHPFTIAGAVQEYPRVTIVVAANGDYSRLLRRLRVGAQVHLDGPYGAMTQQPGGGPTLMLVAGAGISAALAILWTAARRGDRDRHAVVLSVRNADAVPFLDILDRLRRRLRLEVVITVTQPSPGWNGEQGRVDAALLRRHGLLERLSRRTVVICGPDGFVAAMEDLVLELGADPDRVRSERFDVV